MNGEKPAYRILMRKPEGKRPLGRPRRRWADIKMDLKEIRWASMDYETSGFVKVWQPLL
jgi:hypothetical protein